ncbi:MAG: hypothetical protein O3B76_01790 [Proteobacteria bacterium]|nr:hypothetical protein [Pseudomonadota bacterium]MDA1022732.1 hypothetical protein [Pseudomonadota bacterium]
MRHFPKKLTKIAKATAAAVLGALVIAAPVQAGTLYESIADLVKNQKQIKAAEADLEKMVNRDNGSETFRSELDTLALMAFDGIVEIKGNHITITPKGRPWMRTVASVFDRYLGAGEARHSRAV